MRQFRSLSASVVERKPELRSVNMSSCFIFKFVRFVHFYFLLLYKLCWKQFWIRNIIEKEWD